MFWRELKQFACIRSQCHGKLGEQQLNSVCRPTLIHTASIVCRFIHSLQQTQDIQQMLVYCWPNVCDVAPTLTKHWCKLRLCLLRVSSLWCLLYIYRPIWVTSHYFWLTCNFYLNARNQSDQFAASLVSVCLTGGTSCSEYVLWELPGSATTMPFGISSRTNNVTPQVPLLPWNYLRNFLK